MLRNILEPLGYELWLTSSAAEGYARACESRQDLIVSDLHMPEEDGFSFLRRIAASTQFVGIPFVFISSTVCNERDRQVAQQLSATRFLVRPIEPEVLLDEIAAVLMK